MATWQHLRARERGGAQLSFDVAPLESQRRGGQIGAGAWGFKRFVQGKRPRGCEFCVYTLLKTFHRKTLFAITIF
jgi:hypothetical protein